MGNHRSGRKPNPLRLKLLREKNLDRINFDEPQPRRGVPDCPEGRSPEFRAAWEKFATILNEMDVLTVADGVGLEGLCDAWVAYRSAVSVSEGAPPVIDAAKGGTRINPAHKATREAWQVVQKLLIEYGMTPYSRSSLKRISTKKQDPLEEFIASGDSTKKAKHG